MDWADFTERLARELAGLHPQMVLVVHRSIQGSHYVQAFRTGDSVHAEAVSSEVLVADLRFDPRSEDRLAELGWERPEAYGNWTFDLPFASPPSAFRRLASIMVIALRDVQGAQEPSELRYEAFRDAVFLDLAELGLAQSDPARPTERHIPPPLDPVPEPTPPPEPPSFAPQTQPLSLPFPPEPPSAPEPVPSPPAWDAPFAPAASSGPGIPAVPTPLPAPGDPLGLGRPDDPFGPTGSSNPGIPTLAEPPGDPLDPNTPIYRLGPTTSSDPGIPTAPTHLPDPRDPLGLGGSYDTLTSVSEAPVVPADPLGSSGAGDLSDAGDPLGSRDPLGSMEPGGSEETQRFQPLDGVPRVSTPEPSVVPESAVSPPPPPRTEAPDDAEGAPTRARTNKTAIRLAEAKANGDRNGYLAALLSAELYVAGTVVYEDGVYVRAFTAPPPEPHQATDLRTLAGQWPQPHWQLAVDDGQPSAGYLDPFTIAKIGRPPVRTVMQKVLPHPLVVHYLEGGYDRVAGYVHRVSDVLQLTTPKQMYAMLGLGHPGSSFSPDDDSVHVLRWHARFAEMLRRPYGGTDEAAMTAMPGGWVIEHPPFDGTGFASGTGLTIPEFKIDSQRLPHGAEIYRFDRSGRRTLVALFDADGTRWVAV